MDGKFVKVITKKQVLALAIGALVLGFVGGKIFSLEAGANLLSLLLSVWGACCAVYAAGVVAFFLNNRKATLRLEGQRIAARYGFGKTLDCAPDDLSYAAVGPNMLTLEVGGTLHDITGLANVPELAAWLKEKVPFIVPRESKDILLRQREEATRQRKQGLIAMGGCLALALIFFLLARSFLSGKDLTRLSGGNLALFSLLLALFLASAAASALFIRRVSHAIRQLSINRDKLRCLAIATTALPEHDVIGVFYDGYAVRLSLCADPEDKIYYVSEKMGSDYDLHPFKSSEPSDDTTKVDMIIDQMRDISFLFGLE